MERKGGFGFSNWLGPPNFQFNFSTRGLYRLKEGRPPISPGGLGIGGFQKRAGLSTRGSFFTGESGPDAFADEIMAGKLSKCIGQGLWVLITRILLLNT